jgi:hypothetical protein
MVPSGTETDLPAGARTAAAPQSQSVGWLFSVPALGYPLLIISAVVVNTEIVRSVRWRRQYEQGIDRLILTRALTEMPAPGDPS